MTTLLVVTNLAARRSPARKRRSALKRKLPRRLMRLLRKTPLPKKHRQKKPPKRLRSNPRLPWLTGFASARLRAHSGSRAR